jgi:hypothetical protein
LLVAINTVLNLLLLLMLLLLLRVVDSNFSFSSSAIFLFLLLLLLWLLVFRGSSAVFCFLPFSTAVVRVLVALAAAHEAPDQDADDSQTECLGNGERNAILQSKFRSHENAADAGENDPEEMVVIFLFSSSFAVACAVFLLGCAAAAEVLGCCACCSYCC